MKRLLAYSLSLFLLAVVASACEREAAGPGFEKKLLLTYSVPENWYTDLAGGSVFASAAPDLFLFAFDQEGKRLAVTSLEAGKTAELWAESEYTAATVNFGLAMVYHEQKSINISAFTAVPVGQEWVVRSYFVDVPEEKSFRLELVNPDPRTAYYIQANGTNMVLPVFSEHNPSASSSAFVSSPLMLYWEQEGNKYYKYLNGIDFSATNVMDVSTPDGAWKWKTVQMPYPSRQFYYLDRLLVGKQPQSRYDKISFGASSHHYPSTPEGTVEIQYPEGFSWYEFRIGDMNSLYKLAYNQMPDRLEIPELSFSVLNPSVSKFESHLKGPADLQYLRFHSNHDGYATLMHVAVPAGHASFTLPDLQRFFPAEIRVPAYSSFFFAGATAVLLDNIDGYDRYLEGLRTNELFHTIEKAKIYVVKDFLGAEGGRVLRHEVGDSFGLRQAGN